MTRLQSFIVLLCSVAGLVLCVVWYINTPGFEPALGVVLGIGGIVASHWPWQAKRRLTAEQKLAARDRWRPIFDAYFMDVAQAGHGPGDAIVHDVSRLDTYPNIKESAGISPWFRCGLMGTYNRGILLGLEWAYVIEEDGKSKVSRTGTEGDKVILVGEVPFESIESVNLDGDHYYNKPHLFCHFAFRGQPYERLFYAIQNKLPNGPYFYSERLEYSPPKWWRGLADRLGFS